MRSLIRATALLVLGSCGGALAQTADSFNWGGFYIGAHVSGQLGGSSLDGFNNQVDQFTNATVPGRGLVVVPGTTIAVPGSGMSASSVAAGFQAGYGFALGSNWVLGAEGDLRLGDQGSTFSYTAALPVTILQSPSTATITRSVNSNFGWSLRARAGYAWDAFLVYATAGIAGGEFKVKGDGTFNGSAGNAATCVALCAGTVAVTAVTNTTTGTDILNPVGWTLGGGGEWAIGGPFSIGLEYRHTDYGSQTASLATNPTSLTVPTITAPAGSTTTVASAPLVEISPTHVNMMDDSISLRINVHF